MAEERKQVDGQRLPPQAVEIEMAVIGAMLIEQEAVLKALEMLDETSFYLGKHQKIFKAMLALFERNEAADALTVSEELSRRGQLEEVGGTYYLTECTSKVVSAANIEYHCKIIVEKAVLRKLITTATEITKLGYEGQNEAFDLLDQAEQNIFKISQHHLRKGFFTIKDILHDTFKMIERYHERKGFVTGVASGFDDLDRLTSGFQPSDLIIIAARPSMGKTAFCLNIARNAAVKNKVPVAIFSLEMSMQQLGLRLLCSEAQVSSHEIRTGVIRHEDWSKLSTSIGNLSEAPIFIDDTPAIGILELRAKARRLKAEHTVGLIIIDYLQLIRGPARSESRQQEISQISQSLKALAKELEVPVIALSQLSRAVEMRTGKEKKPILSDLRESGALEQDADVVIFIYRPDAYLSGVEGDGGAETGVAEILVRKQRNGPTGEVKLVFIKEYAKFGDMARDYSY